MLGGHLLFAQNLHCELVGALSEHCSVEPLTPWCSSILNPVGVQKKTKHFRLYREVYVLRHIAGDLRKPRDVEF